ncbi:(+)-neomenthol dehydrogenase [Apostasia shenzhenica]|uniref:(+)-neomenthol dehydrogenase n=1 Tax=Apostasia shenzhenica TaxID=1088818 RepID=A0A2I0BGM1_9ASPA|nr:(+)-neomenthol dehydrogenase [Apostasia shenzhenica]
MEEYSQIRIRLKGEDESRQASTSAMSNNSIAAGGLCAVVTGGNKGMGLEVVRLQLAGSGVSNVALTSSDKSVRVAAVRSLHSAANFDIFLLSGKATEQVQEVIHQNHENAEISHNTNYFGVKRVTESLLPLLRQSPSGGHDCQCLLPTIRAQGILIKL